MEIVRLRAEQVPEAAAVLARAFQDDPAWSWVLPSADAAREGAAVALPARLRADRRRDLDDGRARSLGGARWLPPGRPARARAATAVRAASSRRRCGSAEATSRFLAYGRAVDNLRRAAPCPCPHWYLAGIGVEPAEQRRGHRRRAARAGLEAAERDGVPCALLTNAEREPLLLRARHGFEVVLEGETPPGGPHAWMMVKRLDGLAARPLDSRR